MTHFGPFLLKILLHLMDDRQSVLLLKIKPPEQLQGLLIGLILRAELRSELILLPKKVKKLSKKRKSEAKETKSRPKSTPLMPLDAYSWLTGCSLSPPGTQKIPG